jgi:hypothetical protein
MQNRLTIQPNCLASQSWRFIAHEVRVVSSKKEGGTARQEPAHREGMVQAANFGNGENAPRRDHGCFGGPSIGCSVVTPSDAQIVSVRSPSA